MSGICGSPGQALFVEVEIQFRIDGVEDTDHTFRPPDACRDSEQASSFRSTIDAILLFSRFRTVLQSPIPLVLGLVMEAVGVVLVLREATVVVVDAVVVAHGLRLGAV